MLRGDIMIYNSVENRKDYFPPLLSNGDLSLSSDYEGSVNCDLDILSEISAHKGRIFRAGRRQSFSYKQGSPAPLMNWGQLKFDCGFEADSFTQELHEYDGYVSSVSNYGKNLTINTQCFVHQNYNLYAIKKTFSNNCKMTITYSIDDVIKKEAKAIAISEKFNRVSIDMEIKAYDTYSSKIILTSDKIADISIGEDNVTFNYQVSAGESICFYYIIEDSLYCDDYILKTEDIFKKTKEGFDALLSENIKIWNDYHGQGYVKTGNNLIDSTYRTAMYGLKCCTTKWSVAIGINDKSWNGKFFAFDEYYCFLGLLQSNKTAYAKRVPEFRNNVCLERAINRATDYSQNPDVIQALFPWETGEHGEELATPGFWMEHIFHIALIALGAFEYYEYTMDKEFLTQCYPMIQACAKYYTLSAIYENSDGSLYIRKCTDLERLGASVENPFFTSCGVIKTLETFVKASEILNRDSEYRKECDYKAKMLRKSLPNDGEKYVPFKECSQKSMAIFAGKYPFDVIDNTDPKLLPSLNDFEKCEKEYGNMYPYGKKISMWYASWKSVVYARMKMAEKALYSITQAIESVGAFSETYEINEGKYHVRPWFATAAGVLTSAINEMLIQSDGENIYLLPALGEEFSTVSFKLSVKGGAVVEVAIENNQIKKLDITFLPAATPKKFKIFLRGKQVE